MTDPRNDTPTATPSSGWLVGDDAPRVPSAPGRDEQRAARLAARLDVYSRYAALMAEEAAAVLRGDVARAEALASARAALTEQHAELQAAAEGAVLDDPASFGDLFADALREVDHRTDVDFALRRQLERMAEGLRALPAPRGEQEGSEDAPAVARGADAGTDGGGDGGPAIAGVVAALSATLVEARSQGVVGGALSGYFPGATGGAGGGTELATAYAPDEGGSGEGRRLDVRF